MAKACRNKGIIILAALILAAFAVTSSASAGVDFGQSDSSSYPSQQPQDAGGVQAQVSGQNMTANMTIEREAALAQIRDDLNQTAEHIQDYASLAGKDLQERAEGEIRQRVKQEVPGPGLVPALGAVGAVYLIQRRRSG